MDSLRQLLGPFWGVGRDVLGLTAWLVVLSVIFIPLERFLALHDQPVRRKFLFRDVTYYFMNSLLLSLFLAFPLAIVAWGLNKVVPTGVQTMAAGWPPLARFAAALVAGEIGGYWGHRLLHEVPFLWRFHALHHSCEQIDFMANCRAHPLDLAFTRICGYIPLYALGLLQPFASVGDPAMMGFVVVGTIWAFFIHANIRLRFGWFEYLFVTPAFHHWHHTRHDHVNHNYATVLPWVDRIFGTYHMPKNQWPDEYGTDDKLPETLGGQLLYPLRDPR
jgi:sterol desaturase/sphingolipid hydroxylase (fatty acid hydroxylase superfamily)